LRLKVVLLVAVAGVVEVELVVVEWFVGAFTFGKDLLALVEKGAVLLKIALGEVGLMES